MGAVTNYPFQGRGLGDCGATAIKFNDYFDGVDIDNPPEQIEVELQKAVNKLDALRVEVFNEQIRFKELVNAYNTTLRNTTLIRRFQCDADYIIDESRTLSKCHLGFMKRKFDIMNKYAAMPFNFVQEKMYRDKLNDIDKALKFFENVTIFRARVAKKFDLPNGCNSLTPYATAFFPFMTVLASYLSIKV